MQRKIAVFGIVMGDRAESAPEVQEVLTRHGLNILMRSGVHSPGEGRGIITLVVEGTENERQELEGSLAQVEGVVAKSLVFDVAPDRES